MKTSGNTILITGASAGIGQQLAWRWSEAGNTVIATARSQKGLEETAKGRDRIHPRVLDVTDPEAVADFARGVVAEFPALNVLVNNAGIMRLEDAAAARDLADDEDMITTNILGPLRMTNALVDHLRTAPDAAIVNVTSGLAYVPSVRGAVYSATKAAARSWTDSLRFALKDAVEVIELAPPGVQTGLTPGQSTREGYMPLDEYIDEVMGLFAQVPTPPVIAVQRVVPLRATIDQEKYDAVFAALNAG
ncbi:SDR family oxidoreductase [Novosphingobium aquimarinum]|uniref:SDR family oxidoreductase n=1 Tax=Novosphingobium aquimarinum TaxID=2682494 RepID=UPI0012EB3873|nr:SDR family NAD(P)-dependent oxidoreductase [Novosphingobium aquimarinum]